MRLFQVLMLARAANGAPRQKFESCFGRNVLLSLRVWASLLLPTISHFSPKGLPAYHVACGSWPGQGSQKPISQELGYEFNLCFSGGISLRKEEWVSPFGRVSRDGKNPSLIALFLLSAISSRICWRSWRFAL